MIFNRTFERKKILKFTCLAISCLLIQVVRAQDKNPVSWNEAQKQEIKWYASTEAIRVADNVLLFQNKNGGWFKNTDITSRLNKTERERILKQKNKTLGTTIDNGATYSQLRYLAKVYNQTRIDKYKLSFSKGVDYLLKAQYNNGGWPQFYPLKGGYYDHITFNDEAMTGVMFLFHDIVNQKTFDFINSDKNDEIIKALKKAEDLILKTQIRIDGKPTLWCAQHHRKDLSPAKARSYELPSLSGKESVGVVNYLMRIKQPSEEVKTSINSAVGWFQNHKIEGKAVVYIDAPSFKGKRDRIVIKDKKANPLWARFNEIGTFRPMFVGRDGVVRDSLHKIEHERRVGYSYLGDYAFDLLNKDYPNWLKKISNN